MLVDGIDPFADERTHVGLACRMFRTPAGIAGSPTVEQLREAGTRARALTCDARSGVVGTECRIVGPVTAGETRPCGGGRGRDAEKSEERSGDAFAG